MRVPIYQIDAFTRRVFGGNPAAVCPLDSWPDDAVLQSTASENNLSETAFLVGGNGRYDIRWFTPKSEVDLCGHATLASAWLVLNRLEQGLSRVVFDSRSGPLPVEREDDELALDFPSRPPQPCGSASDLVEALGRRPREILASRDYLAVFDGEDEVRSLRPDMVKLAALDRLGVIVTAPGRDVDFVSRFFAPTLGIPEDPVTGSAHCTLVPYWSRCLGKGRLHALQVSERLGELRCEDRGDRVRIAGHAVLYLEGTIHI